MFINRHLIAFVKGHEKDIIETCVLQLVLTLLASMVSLGIAFVVRMIQGETRILFFTELWQVFLFISLVMIARYVLAFKKAVVAEKSGVSIKTTLRNRLLKQLFSLGPAYTSRSRTGNIASTISTMVEYLNEYFTIYLPSAISSILNAWIIISVLGVFNPLTAFVCVISCTGLLICPMVFYFLMRRRGAEEMRMHSQYYSDCLDSIQGMTTLKAFNANGRQKQIIHNKGEQLRQAIMGHLKITMLENMVLQIFAGLGSAFSIAVAAYQTANGFMTPENLVYALFLIGACFVPFHGLISAWHLGYRGVTASYGIEKLLNEPVRRSLLIEPKMSPILHPSMRGGISFDQVYFAYHEKDGDVLKKVSFDVPYQTMTALVGASGSGKSTIAHLVAGFYPAREGMITIGGTVLNDHNVPLIQEQIGIVWQDCHLFYGTVEDNIRLGNPDATMEEIVKAAKEASIHDFVDSLPDKYQTMIGERGMRFSGGERQRIALARVFLRNPTIVILDEATSSLDRKNEIVIQEGFHRLRVGKTALVIAHRLETIRNADQIVIMDSGKVHARGTHDSLLKTTKKYRELMGSQINTEQMYEL